MPNHSLTSYCLYFGGEQKKSRLCLRFKRLRHFSNNIFVKKKEHFWILWINKFFRIYFIVFFCLFREKKPTLYKFVFYIWYCVVFPLNGFQSVCFGFGLLEIYSVCVCVFVSKCLCHLHAIFLLLMISFTMFNFSGHEICARKSKNFQNGIPLWFKRKSWLLIHLFFEIYSEDYENIAHKRIYDYITIKPQRNKNKNKKWRSHHQQANESTERNK